MCMAYALRRFDFSIMARDSFVFYRSFFEAIQCMPSEVQAEIYPALVDYALNGTKPDALSDIARGVFLLVKPIIDANNARAEGGSKGKKYGRLGGRPKKDKAVSAAVSSSATELPASPAPYTLSLEQEVSDMLADRSWNEPVCMQFHLTPDELSARMDAFLTHCRCEYDGKPHKDFNDAKRHFCSWMRKKYPQAEVDQKADDQLPPPSYEFNGGFGGQDV